ncbi:MAG: hypothetical protein GY895_04485 [Phycisphaera sp.]|nr:hypothetical protein [Phycisphaera sp.]
MTAPDPGSHDPSPASGPTRTGGALRPRNSRLAITAFAIGVAGICPMLGLVAMVLGFVANLRIVRSGGRLRGRGYALWGLGLGTATTFIWLSLWDIAGTRVLETLESRMETQIRVVLDAGRDGDANAIRSAMAFEPGLHELGIQRFIAEVGGDGLDAWSISITNLRQAESGSIPVEMDVDVRLDTTDQAIWTGTANFFLEPPLQPRLEIDSLISNPRLQTIRLIGPDGRSIRLPESPDPIATPAPSDEEGSDGDGVKAEGGE